MIDLTAHQENAVGELTSLDVIVRTYTVREMFKVHKNIGLHWLTDYPAGMDHGFVQAMLLKLPLPTVYVHEGHNGESYSVIVGAKLIETLRYLNNHFRYGESEVCHPALERRIRDTCVNVVIFRCSMSYADAERRVKMLGVLDAY